LTGRKEAGTDPARLRPFVDAKAVCKMLAALLFVVGIMASLGGQAALKIGRLAKSRYEASSGQLLRKFSQEDQSYYKSAKRLIVLGHFARTSGAIVIVLAAAGFFMPGMGLQLMKKRGMLCYTQAKGGVDGPG
jgi:hypothetical protein